MAEITTSMLEAWRDDPASFIESQLYDPDERSFIKLAFTRDDDGRLVLCRAVVQRAPQKRCKRRESRQVGMTVDRLMHPGAGRPVKHQGPEPRAKDHHRNRSDYSEKRRRPTSR
jgi:hypothetical protein